VNEPTFNVKLATRVDGQSGEASFASIRCDLKPMRSSNFAKRTYINNMPTILTDHFGNYLADHICCSVTVDVDLTSPFISVAILGQAIIHATSTIYKHINP
jgi:hypothetical protein